MYVIIVIGLCVSTFHAVQDILFKVYFPQTIRIKKSLDLNLPFHLVTLYLRMYHVEKLVCPGKAQHPMKYLFEWCICTICGYFKVNHVCNNEHE